MPRGTCKNNPDNFCYICGCVTTKAYKRKISNYVKKLYKLYFEIEVGDQDKKWAPHICCSFCFLALSKWANGSGKGLKFGVPMVWREPQNHTEDCYFCLTKTQGKYILT